MSAGRSAAIATPNISALNPNGLVPTVKDGDLVMWESNTICRYLAATRNGERLYPRDPGARTHVERWMDWQLAVIGAADGPAAVRAGAQQPRDARPRRDRGGAAPRARRLDHRRRRRSKDRPYLAGDRLSLAEIVLGHADLPLVRLSDRAAGAAQSARLVRPAAPAPRLQDAYRDADNLTVRGRHRSCFVVCFRAEVICRQVVSSNRSCRRGGHE